MHRHQEGSINNNNMVAIFNSDGMLEVSDTERRPLYCLQLPEQCRARETTDLLLELLTFLRGEGICFGDQRDDINFLMQPFHELNVQWLQSVWRREQMFVWEALPCVDRFVLNTAQFF